MPPRTSTGPSANRITRADLVLHSIRNRFGTEVAATKERLLQEILHRPPQTLRQLVNVHDDLLFLRAFPENAQLAELARQALDRVAHQLLRIPRAMRAELDDSGIASSNSRHTFPYAIARWLARSHPNEVEIDWRAAADASPIDALVRAILTRAEEDGFDDPTLSLRDWLRVAQPRSAASTLTWLIEQAESRATSRRTFAAIYDSAPLPIVWRLAHSRGSTTNASAGGQSCFRSFMRRPPPSPLRHVATPLTGLRLLQPTEASRVIDLTRAALTSRCREVYPISNANPDEVWLADLGEGTSLAIIGAAPPYRMSLETNYGYLLMSNGIPIGYGGVTPLFHQANTGINIFEPFRGSEGAFLWLQMLRAFHSLFGVRRFLVNPYQFGQGNVEAIQSGAFWFYYRLGFRPSDAATRALAAREAQRLARRHTYRSTPAVLRQLARGDLYLTLPGFRAGTFFPERLLATAALRVTTRLAAAGSGRGTALEASVWRVQKTLGVRSMARWPQSERRAFELLAPVADLLPDLGRWSASDRQGLIQLLRAKGAPQERTFVVASHEHPRFWMELRRELRRLTSRDDALGGMHSTTERPSNSGRSTTRS